MNPIFALIMIINGNIASIPDLSQAECNALGTKWETRARLEHPRAFVMFRCQRQFDRQPSTPRS